MPPKIRFSREKVIDSAFVLIKNKGINHLSARNVAAVIGSSTAPIYSYFKTIDELRDSALKKAEVILNEYIDIQKGQKSFTDLGLAVLLFARDLPNIYKALFIDLYDIDEYRNLIHSKFTSVIKNEAKFKKLNKVESNDLVLKVWLLIHGYATYICSGADIATEENEISIFLEDTISIMVNDVLGVTPKKKKRKDETLSLF